MPNAQDYRDTQVMTASPMQLIIMLYDECIRSLKAAEKAFEIESPDRIAEICNNILHAQDIITELMMSLDMEKGADIASNLERLYDFMIQHLSDANIKKEVEPVIEVRELMSELREAWLKVAENEPASETNSRYPDSTTSSFVVAG